jgi:dienelactone hydrolase
MLFSCVVAFVGFAVGQEARLEADANELTLKRVLAIERVGRYGRSAVHTDAIAGQLVRGDWTPPTAGQEIERPGGGTCTWQVVEAEDDGWLRHNALVGGYAYAAIHTDEPRTMLLEASGHSEVFVNGVPRPGDPYRTGYVHLPVALNAGTNHLLFRCGRGELRVSFKSPASPVAIATDDCTLPDLVVAEPVDAWAGVIIINASEEPLTDAVIVAGLGERQTVTAVPPIAGQTLRKIPVHLLCPPPAETGDREVSLTLYRNGERSAENVLNRATVTISCVAPDEARRITFISDIDGSVQYYGLQPMRRADNAATEPPALFLTLHGAGVEGIGQARAYKPKDWGHVVAATNRRPFGFDWEDWGRRDAIEVLELASARLGTDPRRTYLTGHSMGGHGTWQVGVTYPCRFAAIAPSAGWISFWSYAGGRRFNTDSPIADILTRASNPSDTLALSRNYLQHGVYILHGDADDNVPVQQAREMRAHLGSYHADFTYYERPGAGHWWGNACVDWPPLFDFLRDHVRPATAEVRHIEFVTANPAISATCHWATIEAQQQSLALSRIDLRVDPEKRRISGTTENVDRLSLTLQPGGDGAAAEGSYVLPPGEPLTIELDGRELADVAWPAGNWLRLKRTGDAWAVVDGAAAGKDDDSWWRKSPQRAGPFKEVFANRVQLVYGTRGTPEENAWTFAKARYDAEMFWYRGNGALELIADTAFVPDPPPGRNVVLYGNADTNAAWATLAGNCPVQVSRGRVDVGDHAQMRDDLAVLAVYPRRGSDRALVGIVGGSGPVGMRLTMTLPYFVSGVAYPDWIVLDPTMLTGGLEGVRAAGFFSNDWQLDPDQSAWAQPEPETAEEGGDQ